MTNYLSLRNSGRTQLSPVESDASIVMYDDALVVQAFKVRLQVRMLAQNGGIRYRARKAPSTLGQTLTSNETKQWLLLFLASMSLSLGISTAMLWVRLATEIAFGTCTRSCSVTSGVRIRQGPYRSCRLLAAVSRTRIYNSDLKPNV